ncbi:MAG: flagellar motor switch protein FliN [Candidatus Latescibacterota bacterium]
MAAGKDKQPDDDQEKDDLLGSFADDDLETQMATTMAVDGMAGSEEEDDLEAQMAAAMALEGEGAGDDDLERPLSIPMRNGGGRRERNDFLDALAGEDSDANLPVQPLRFQQLRPTDEDIPKDDITRLLDISLNVSVELGRKQMQIKEILELGPGKIVELEKLAGEPVDLMVNGKLLARGEVVVVDENFGVRITELIDPKDRIKML